MERKENKPQPLLSTLMAFNSLAFVVLLLVGTFLLIKSQSIYRSFIWAAANDNSDPSLPSVPWGAFAIVYWISLVVGVLCIIVAAILLWNIIDLVFFVVEIPGHLKGPIAYQDFVKQEIKYCYSKY